MRVLLLHLLNIELRYMVCNLVTKSYYLKDFNLTKTFFTPDNPIKSTIISPYFRMERLRRLPQAHIIVHPTQSGFDCTKKQLTRNAEETRLMDCVNRSSSSIKC